MAEDNLVENSVINVAFVGEEEMERLNKKFRGKEGAVPVLAFPMGEKGPDGINQLGDVVICLPMAKELAEEKNRTVDEMIGELAAHGVKQLL